MQSKGLGSFLAGLILLMTAALVTPCAPASAARPQLAGGMSHTVGLKTDGTVMAVGDNQYSQLDVSSWTDIVAVAAGAWHTVGVKADGTVVGVGMGTNGQLNVSSWTDIVGISAGYFTTVGVKSDGTAVAVGYNVDGETEVSSWTNITAVAGGYTHTVGLKADGTVVATGYNGYGETDVSGWTNIIAVAAGYFRTVGLRADGTVVAAGYNVHGETDVSLWSNITAVATGYYHTVGLKSDGTLVGTGSDEFRQLNVSRWTDTAAMAAGYFHTVGLKSDGNAAAVGSNGYGQLNVSAWQQQTLDTDIKGGRGTQVILTGSGFGMKRGTVVIAGTYARVVTWLPTRIIFTMPVSLAPGQYPIYAFPPGRGPIMYGKPFIMKAPQLQFVQASEGYAGDKVVLTGKYFGSKKGTIAVGTRSCPVSYWYMDPTSGESVAAFRLPFRMTPGTYNIILVNEAGSATFPMVVFTVKSGKSISGESSSNQED